MYHTVWANIVINDKLTMLYTENRYLLNNYEQYTLSETLAVPKQLDIMCL